MLVVAGLVTRIIPAFAERRPGVRELEGREA